MLTIVLGPAVGLVPRCNFLQRGAEAPRGIPLNTVRDQHSAGPGADQRDRVRLLLQKSSELARLVVDAAQAEVRLDATMPEQVDHQPMRDAIEGARTRLGGADLFTEIHPDQAASCGFPTAQNLDDRVIQLPGSALEAEAPRVLRSFLQLLLTRPQNRSMRVTPRVPESPLVADDVLRAFARDDGENHFTARRNTESSIRIEDDRPDVHLASRLVVEVGDLDDALAQPVVADLVLSRQQTHRHSVIEEAIHVPVQEDDPELLARVLSTPGGPNAPECAGRVVQTMHAQVQCHRSRLTAVLPQTSSRSLVLAEGGAVEAETVTLDGSRIGVENHHIARGIDDVGVGAQRTGDRGSCRNQIEVVGHDSTLSWCGRCNVQRVRHRSRRQKKRLTYTLLFYCFEKIYLTGNTTTALRIRTMRDG